MPTSLSAAPDADRSTTNHTTAASWELDARQLAELESLLNGAFAPLQGFLVRRDYDRVLAEERLADGRPWLLPIALDVSEALAATIAIGSEVVLRDSRGTARAVLSVEDIYWTDHLREARQRFGTTERRHPGVAELLERRRPVYLGGRVRALDPPSVQGRN